jgi:hypothetical protein
MCSRFAVLVGFLAMQLVLPGRPAAAEEAGFTESTIDKLPFLSCRVPLEFEEDEDADAGNADTQPRALTLLDCTNLKVLARNLQQEDESGNSQFGIGLDWDYSFEHTWQEAPFNPTLAVNGQGRTSLGDPNSGRNGANDVANGNAILNQIRFTAKGIHGPQEPKLDAGPFPVGGSKEEQEEWKRRASEHVKKVAYIQATEYTALDFGLHSRAESNQDFRDTQVAVGLGATAASGWLANWVLWPFKLFVPDASEYGDVVQSPIVFVGFDGVFAAHHRSQIDGASDDEFPRLRLELGWTSELLVPGLYPFFHFDFLHEFGAGNAIEAAGKETTTFFEVGADYYVGTRLSDLRQFFGGSGGPFVTLKYSSGRLPPYLEKNKQVSVGLGLEF